MSNAIRLAFSSNETFEKPPRFKQKSYSENKQLAKQIFDSINSYRKSLGQAAFIWEENYYVTAKTHNDYLNTNGLWGHRNNYQPGTELIVAVNNLSELISL